MNLGIERLSATEGTPTKERTPTKEKTPTKERSPTKERTPTTEGTPTMGWKHKKQKGCQQQLDSSNSRKATSSMNAKSSKYIATKGTHATARTPGTTAAAVKGPKIPFIESLFVLELQLD
jgi:hypothetical protein